MVEWVYTGTEAPFMQTLETMPSKANSQPVPLGDFTEIPVRTARVFVDENTAHT